MKRSFLILLLAAASLAGDEPKVWLHAPAEDLLTLFPEKEAGFLISIEEYEKLVRLARAHEAERADEPPLPARIVRGAVAARVTDERGLEMEAQYVAVVSGKGPAEIPFPLQGVALERVAVDRGELVGDRLRFEGPGTYVVTAVCSARLSAGDVQRAAFRLPPAAAHTVSIDLPPDVEGEVGPIVRAFQSGAGGGRVVGFPDRNGLFKVWMKSRSPARRLDPLVTAGFHTVATVGEAGTIVTSRLDLEVLRAPIDRVKVRLDPGQTVRDLKGKQVKRWTLQRGPAGDELAILFTDPVEGAVQVTIETEIAREADRGDVAVPFPKVPAAARTRGTIGVAPAARVRVTDLRATGARRLDDTGKGAVALFEVWSDDAAVTATVERVAAKTEARTRALLAFREGGKSLRARIAYRIAGQPVFRLEPTLPPGWILRALSLDGQPYPHRLLDDGRLGLVFPAGLKPGVHVLDVTLDTDEVDWVANEGAVDFELAGVRAGLEEETGVLVVASDPAFRVSAAATDGLQAVGMPEIAREGFAPSDRILYGWRFDAPGYAARFRLERHRPQITATVVTRLFPSERLLKVHATVDLDIRRTGVRELKVALPKGTGPLVDFQGAGIKERRAPAADADPEVWTLVFQRRVRGAYRLGIGLDKTFEDRDAWTAAVPEIALPGVQDRGFLVVFGGGTTALAVDRGGLREADVGELSEQPPRTPLEVLAYARHPYRVAVSSRRHDPEAVVQAIALTGHIYGVLTPEGRLRCRAEYRVRNNDQPFLSFKLPPESRLLGVLVNGEPNKPLREQGSLKVPLPRSRNREAPFKVALIYESEVEALGDTGELTILRPTLDIDVLKTRYTLHLPHGYALTGHDGDLVPLNVAERDRVIETVLGGIAGRVAVGASAGDSENFVAPGMFVDEYVPNEPAPGRALGRDAARPRSKNKRPESEKAKSRADDKKSVRKSADRRRDREATLDEDALEDAIEDAIEREAMEDAPFTVPNSAVPPSLREPGDPEPPAAPPSDPGVDSGGAAVGPGGGAGGGGGGRVEVAHGGPQGSPTPAPGKEEPPEQRKRPEKSLLSLDIQFLQPDNLVRLDSLAPTGQVKLRYVNTEVFDRRAYLGVVLGGAVAVLLLFTRLAALRVFPAAILLFLALHFAGVSFLPADFALGAAKALAIVFVLAALVRLGGFAVRFRWQRLRWPFRAGVLLLAAAPTARAEEEIVVPYRDDPSKVEQVFLPAERYHALRRLAYPETAGRVTAVASAAYAVDLQGEVATVQARYEIVKETDEAEHLALRLGEAAITAATLDGAPARLTVAKKGYVLVLQGAGRKVLELTLRPRLQAKGDARLVAFPVRPVAAAHLTVTHDRAGHEVHVTRLGQERAGTYYIGPVGHVVVTFRPETAGFRAATAELRAQTAIAAQVEDGFTAVRARIRYGISGGSVDRLRIRTGRDLLLRRVACKDLAGWNVDGEHNLVVALKKAATGPLDLWIEAERPVARERTEAFPEIAPLDVLRDAGLLALTTRPDLKLEVLETRGLMRGQAAAAAGELGLKGAIHSVYRYAVRPFGLRWRVFAEETRLRAATAIDVYVEREAVYGDASVTVDVERGPGLFEVPVRVPAGYEVLHAGGPDVRDWWVADGVLTIARTKRLQGKASFTLVMRRRGATGAAFTAPAISVPGAVRETGLVKIAVADGLELEAGETSGLLPEDIAKVGAVKWGRLVRAYRFVSAPWRLEASTREEPREVEALVVSHVTPLADRVRVDAVVNFRVRRGLVDTLTFLVPVAGDTEVLVHAADLREERSEQTDAGRRVTLNLRTPTRGTTSVTVSYHLPAGAPVHGVEPRGVAQTERYVAVDKIPDGEVTVTRADNLEAADFRELPLHPPGTGPEKVARVYVGSGGPFAIDLALKRHSFEEVAKAVIYRAEARAVVDRSGWARVLVSYRVYNRSEQFLRLRLPDGARLYAVVVAGAGARPLAEGEDLLVPLRKLALGAPTFDVDVLFAYRGPAIDDRDFQVHLPGTRGIDVRRTTLSLHVPKDFDYDFETEMEEVEASDLAAGEATDLYEEAKELYSVAERGNRFQAERALSNFAELERKAQRVMDSLRSNVRDQEQLKRIDSQQRALNELRRVASEQKPKPDESAAKAGDWGLNTTYYKRTAGEKRQQLDELRRSLETVTAGETVQAQEGTKAVYGLEGHLLAGRERADVPVYLAGRRKALGELAGYADKAELGIAGLLVVKAGELQEGKDAALKILQDFDVEVGQAAAVGDASTPSLDGATRKLDAGDLRAAKGRISLKIDLPLEGRVFHFARLGPEGSVAFSASATGGHVLEGFLALACAAAAVFVLRFRTAR